MDSSGSPSPDHSWLSFSLSNQYYPPPSNPTSSTPTSTPPHHLSLFQQHPHLFIPPQSVDDGASDSTNHHSHELSFLAEGGGLLQVGLYPSTEAVTIANTGGGGSFYEHKAIAAGNLNLLGGFITDTPEHQQQQLQQVQVQVQDADANNKQLAVIDAAAAAVAAPSSSSRKIVEGFGQRTSIYRGVTRHRWTGRYEAHLWDNSCRREGQSRKGRQVYLGGYDKEEKAARAYDLAALKYWGPTTTTNFPISDYERELEDMKNMSRQEFVASLRRKSSGFSRGASMYRGVTRHDFYFMASFDRLLHYFRHHQHGRWQARIGRVAGNKDLYLGTFSTQEEAAEAYDIAAIKFRGLNAVTNFDISRYDVKSIISSNLPVGGMANKSKPISDHEEIKPLEVIKPELPLISAPHPPSTTIVNHNFIGIPPKPDSPSQNYNWPALGQVDNNETFGYANIGYVQQQPNNDTSEGFNGYEVRGNNDNNVTDSGNVSNNWIVTPNLHSLQSPKQNVTVLQTPIFGIE